MLHFCAVSLDNTWSCTSSHERPTSPGQLVTIMTIWPRNKTWSGKYPSMRKLCTHQLIRRTAWYSEQTQTFATADGAAFQIMLYNSARRSCRVFTQLDREIHRNRNSLPPPPSPDLASCFLRYALPTALRQPCRYYDGGSAASHSDQDTSDLPLPTHVTTTHLTFSIH